MSFPRLPEGRSEQELREFALLLGELYQENKERQVQGHAALESTCGLIADQLDIDAIHSQESFYAQRAALRKMARMCTTFREELSYIFLLAGKLKQGEMMTKKQFVLEMIDAFDVKPHV